MPKDEDYEDDEDKDDSDDDYQMPFDFMKFLQDPNKMFQSKEFQHMFKKVYEKLMENLPPEFKNISPENFQKEFMKNKGKFKRGPFMYGFNVNFDKIYPALKQLAHDVLMLQATGNYEGAKKFMAKYDVISPSMETLREKLKDLPVDIKPVYQIEEEMQ